MGLTSAMNTSLNGLALNETSINVLGNNIANAGTNGFKASQVQFETQLLRTLSSGSRPTADNGGTNPRQIGMGAFTAAIRKDFSQGTITNSTSPSDLAIQGDGFFVLQASDGLRYTRNGSFSLNSESVLVNAQGMQVQGYAVDDDFNLITTELSDLSIPLGGLTMAQQTSNVTLGGALRSAGELATHGTLLLSELLTDSSSVTDATGGSLLADIQNADGQNLFTAGQTLSFSPQKGERTLPPASMEIDGATDLDALMAFFNDVLGIHSGGSIPDDGFTGDQPGVTVEDGRIQVVGNRGTVHDLSIGFGALSSNGAVVPLSFEKEHAAVGESTITDFVVYDSLGEAVTVKMTAVLESRTTDSTTFRWYVDSFDDSRDSSAIANGTIEFDSFGVITSDGTGTFAIERDDTAAMSPLLITADFSAVSGISSATAGSRLALTAQDGAAPGTLSNYMIDEGGAIHGVFDNGIIRTLGQVVLARFANSQGLLEDGGTTFREGPGSGTAFFTTPGSFGAGTIRAGAIELSNTDLGRSLVELIVASSNYRGNARVIGSVQQLVDELLMLGR
jgi:flagellar hook protein FlgE